jgi:TPP-dependent pyruvate/acetoin dehydrogenase alpha subunit
LAFKEIKKTSQIVVCFFGDGALNIGEFHESLNLAGLWKLPVVFVCETNMYAISTHIENTCAIKDIAKRAESYDMPGVTVDGMDVLAVREAAEESVKRARAGKGPCLLVCQTYRYLGHGRNPDCSLYRTKEEEEKWKQRCPIKTFQAKLLNEKIITKEKIESMEKEIVQEIDLAVKFADESPFPVAEDLESDIYAPNNL